MATLPSPLSSLKIFFRSSNAAPKLPEKRLLPKLDIPSINLLIPSTKLLIFSLEKNFLKVSLFKNATNNPNPAALSNAPITPFVLSTPFLIKLPTPLAISCNSGGNDLNTLLLDMASARAVIISFLFSS